MLPMALRTTWLPWVEVREASLAALMASVVLRATSLTVDCISFMAVATWETSLCWLAMPLADCSEMALTSSTALLSWLTEPAISLTRSASAPCMRSMAEPS
ncbi:hypothetical protein D3C80_1210250 [compost metagenome]